MIINANDIASIDLPVSSNGWTELSTKSEKVYSAYIVEKLKIPNEDEVDLDLISIDRIKATKQYEKVLINNSIQYLLVIANESESAITVEININNIPVRSLPQWGTPGAPGPQTSAFG